MINNKKKSVSLTAVGDVLLHASVYGGLNKTSGYTFNEQLKNVKHLLGKTDLTVANLETIIAGNSIGLSEYPKFNAPVEIGYTLKEMGVDLVTIANNHVLDRGEEGLLKSIENLETIGLEYDGAYKSAKDKKRLRIIDVNGLKVCFLSFTRGTNKNEVPADKPFLVNTLKNNPIIKINNRMRWLKERNIVDVIVVNMHFGKEYHLFPSRYQRELAASLSDGGADVIIGHHPHVLQPPEWIENSRGTKTFVAYSMGNFFSGQNGVYRQIGATLTLDLVKPNPEYKEVIVKNPSYRLTFTKKESNRVNIYELEKWIKKNKTIETTDALFRSKEVYKKIKNRMKEWIPDLDIS